MKGVEVYHTIKVLSSRGYSIREISKKLKISKTTVLKYLRISDKQASQDLLKVNRSSEFDQYRDYLIDQISLFPSIRITKLYRKLLKNFPEIKSSRRSFHNYIKKIHPFAKNHSKRHYEPIETSPGIQVQVDPGEQKIKLPNGKEQKIYFVAFVFSFSRMKYVYFQDYPFDTLSFIKAHKEAFKYFGYMATDYVYDQTKLVVINEKYREVWLNERFHQFANKSRFTPHVCEGYDPESKGKVERVVQEVKKDFLYGDFFESLDDVRNKSYDWLLYVNNQIHSTTNEKPKILFDEEISYCKKYISEKSNCQKRLVDKVGLISFEGNKYSVPESYQQCYVNVSKNDRLIEISDINTNEKITEHSIPLNKGKIVKNSNHYRNYSDKLSDLLKKIKAETSMIPEFEQVIETVCLNNPKIVRDQIRGLRKIVKTFETDKIKESIPLILSHFNLTACKVENILMLEEKRKKVTVKLKIKENNTSPEVLKSELDRDLDYYNEVLS